MQSPHSQDLTMCVSLAVAVAGSNSTLPALSLAMESYVTRGCGDQNKLAGNLFKHAQEMSRMQSPRYQDLTRCINCRRQLNIASTLTCCGELCNKRLWRPT